MHFNNVVACSEDDREVLESLRFRDQDVCLKGGAVLAFAALIIACVLVVLSASKGAHIFIDRGSLQWWAMLVSFWLSLLTALASFTAIVWRKIEYVDDPFLANLQYYEIIKFKNVVADISMGLAASSAISLVVGCTLTLV